MTTSEIENRVAKLKTFKENHGSAEAMKIDLFNHNNINKIVDYLNINNIRVDVLVGGPPCQGFSLAGSRKEDDKRKQSIQKLCSHLRNGKAEDIEKAATIYVGFIYHTNE